MQSFVKFPLEAVYRQRKAWKPPGTPVVVKRQCQTLYQSQHIKYYLKQS